jgi:hypothetical protein
MSHYEDSFQLEYKVLNAVTVNIVTRQEASKQDSELGLGAHKNTRGQPWKNKRSVITVRLRL